MRALVVGLGSIGQRHARNLRHVLGDDLELSALRSSSERRPTVTDGLELLDMDATSDFNGGVFYEIDSALAAQPDMVVIATPSSLHPPVLQSALEAGVAVFVEKPVSHNLVGVDELAALVARTNVIVAVGCQLRFHPALQALKRILDGGELGTLLHVIVEQGEYLPQFHPYEDYRSSYAARSELGGGVVLTQIHEIDYVQWMFGRPSSVFAVGGTVGDLGIDVEDTATALLQCEFHGIPLGVHVHLDFLQRQPRRRCRVVGTRGTVDVDLIAPTLHWVDAEGAVRASDTFSEFNRGQLFVSEIQHFVDAVAHRGEAAVTLEDGIATLRTAIAIRESMTSGLLQFLD